MREIKKKAILISCFDWYDSRLIYIEQYFKTKGYDVKIYLSDYNHKKKCRVKKYCSSNIVYLSPPSYDRNISLKRLYSHGIFSNRIRKIVNQENPNLVYCLVPPNSLCHVISKLKRKMAFKLIFDIIDLWPESMPLDKYSNTRPLKVWGGLRNKNINKADMIVLECNFYRNYLNKFVDSNKINLLYLIKPYVEYFQNIDIEEYDMEHICLCYLGSINHLIDIEMIANIVINLQKIKKIKVKIIGKGDRQDEFINKLKFIGANVEFYGEIYDDKEKINIFKDCHFGLNIYKSNISIGLTTKSVDYFQMGLPIINSIMGDTHKMIKENNLGINIEDLNEETVSSYINNIYLNKNRIRNFFLCTFSDQNIDKRLFFLDRLNEGDNIDKNNRKCSCNI